MRSSQLRTVPSCRLPLRSSILAALAAAVALASACGGGGDGGPSSTPTALRLLSASRQTGRANTEVGSAPSVKVLDSGNKAVSNAKVLFEVTSGGGTVTAASVKTGTDGIATAGWTLGTDETQTLHVSVQGYEDVSRVFSAQVLSGEGYQIDLRLLTDASDVHWKAFQDAAARISQIITAALPPAAVGADGGSIDLGTTSTNFSWEAMTVPNLLILVKIQTIDGENNILGMSGPVAFRSDAGEADDGLPALGIMVLDSADLDAMVTDGSLSEVILHEMLHVVGFGTIWATPEKKLMSNYANTNLASNHEYADYAVTPAGTTTALQWSKAYNDLASSYTYVPVENDGGDGTEDGHWEEDLFGNELMTGWIDAGTNPLSATTLGSLEDLGYTVDVTKADTFSLTSGTGLRAELGTATRRFVGNDILRFTPSAP